MINNIIRNILFFLLDIIEVEIEEVIKVMKLGWIIIGFRIKEFEKKIVEYVGINKVVCLNLVMVVMELIFWILGVGFGDEVIILVYIYIVFVLIIEYVGVKIVLVDIVFDFFEMDYEKFVDVIIEKIKVIILVDIVGKMCDYDIIYSVVESKKDLFKFNNKI